MSINIMCSFFFFKQKTAYDMRISDWSSDVCSSDLPVVIFDRDRETDRRIACLLERDMIAATAEAVGAPDLADVEAEREIVGKIGDRSEERRVGQQCVSTCRSRWSPYQ